MKSSKLKLALPATLALVAMVACGGSAAPAASSAASSAAPAGSSAPASASASPSASASASAASSAAASPSTGASASAGAPATKGTITLGFAGPLTGDAAQFGQQMLNAMKIVVDQANAKGGVLGKKIVIDAGDDKNDPTQAVSVANKLVADKVVGVIGDVTSGPSIAASAVYNEAKIPMISPAATSPKLTEQGFKYVFRSNGRDDQQGPIIARYMLNTLKKKKIAIINDKSAYGQGLAESIRSTLQAAGAKPVAFEGVNGTDKDFSAVLTKIKPLNPDVVFFGGYYTQGGLLVKQMRDLGIQAQFMMGDGAQDNTLIKIAGPAANGMLFTFGPDVNKVPAAQAFLKTYKRKYGTVALYAIYSVDPTNVMIDAIKRAGSANGSKIRDAIASTKNFKGVYWSSISFDSKGDLQAPAYVMWTVKNEKFAQLPGAAQS
ncbi:MAG: branched-chain amino acid ABC transporter substrate-binding protein [Chloroflexota bacterium]